MDAEKFINTDAAADFLSRSVITIRTWAAKGFLPSYKVGGRRLFRVSEIDAWVKARDSGGLGKNRRQKSFIDQEDGG